jgi:hypothetical protein
MLHNFVGQPYFSGSDLGKVCSMCRQTQGNDAATTCPGKDEDTYTDEDMFEWIFSQFTHIRQQVDSSRIDGHATAVEIKARELAIRACNTINVHIQKRKNGNTFERIFDSSNANWMKDVEYTRLFIMTQENYFNNRLIAYGHVFLNEVFDALGFPRTMSGALVGWSDKNKPIVFVMPEKGDFTDGIPLTFNVEGVIYDKIEN